MIKLIDATAPKTELRERLQNYEYRPDDFGIGRCAGLTDAMEIIDRAPTIPAIPVEWLQKLRKDERTTLDDVEFIDWILASWQQEQEAQDE